MMKKKTFNETLIHLRATHQQSEMDGLLMIAAYLIGDKMEALAAVDFIGSCYKEWDEIFIWLKNNKLHGQKLVEFFQNESPDGGGYHMGVTLILSRIAGMKRSEKIIKLDQLI